MRGLALDGENVYVAASDELYAYTPDFKPVGSWRSPFLKNCQGLFAWQRTLYLVSAAYDSILGFDLDNYRFHWAMAVQVSNYRFKGARFDPMSKDGPLMLKRLQLNSIYCSEHGMYLTGASTGGMLHFNGTDINMAVELPADTRDARPFRDGVLFNDTADKVLRYSGRGSGDEDRAMKVPACEHESILHVDAVDDGIVYPGFAQGLCVISDSVVAGGSSPSTISIYNLAANETMGSLNLSRDVRSTIHSIVSWPFD